MDKEFILKNTETLETAARESLHESNALQYKFSDLLIKISFAIGGLAALRIVDKGEMRCLIFSKIGLIFLSISTIFGGIQIMIDRFFFRNNGRLLSTAADRWKRFGIESDSEEALQDARRSMEQLGSLSKTSPELPIYLQITFVILGVIFVLIDVFVK
jgi:hypothetical protein